MKTEKYLEALSLGANANDDAEIGKKCAKIALMIDLCNSGEINDDMTEAFIDAAVSDIERHARIIIERCKAYRNA